MSRVVYVDEDDIVVVRPRRSWRDLYRKLDYVQEQARDRTERIASCSCNPMNGGSGLCYCVLPGGGVWC